MQKPSPLSNDELRALWRASAPGSPERRALLEIARLHDVLRDSMDYLRLVEREWLAATHTRLTALHMWRGMLMKEPGATAALKRKWAPSDEDAHDPLDDPVQIL